MTNISKKAIDKAIRHLNMEIMAGKGYRYFLDLTTGNQIGQAIMVCWYNQLTIKGWVNTAKFAKWQGSN